MKLADRLTRRLSIRKQIVVWNIAALALLLGALGAIVHFTVRTNLMNSVDRDLMKRTNRPPPGPPGFEGGPDGPPHGDGNRDRPGYPVPGAGMSSGTGKANASLSGLPGDRSVLQRQDGGNPEGAIAGQGPQQGPNADGRGFPAPGPQQGPNDDEQGIPDVGPGSQPRTGNPYDGSLRDPGVRPDGRLLPGTPNPDRQGYPGGSPGNQPPPGNMAPGASGPGGGQSGGPRFDDDNPRPRAAAPPPRRPVQIGDNERPQLFNLQGAQVDRNNTNGLWDRSAFNRALHGSIIYSTVTIDGEQLRVISRPFSRRGQIVGIIQAPYHLDDLYRAMDGMDRTLLALVPVGLGFAWIGGLLLTGRVLRPLRHITGVAAGIGADRLEERLPTVGQDEFSVLAVTFNGMLERVQTGFREQQRLVAELKELVERQRRFTADASHELKTPLTIVKANTSLCLAGETDPAELRQSLVDIDGAANTMSKLVQDLLLLASSDEGRLGRNLVKLPIASLIKKSRARIGFAEGPCVILPEDDEALTVYGNEEELVRVFGNLLENAFRYTPATGTVTVKARLGGSKVNESIVKGSMVVVTVADTGPGIAAEHLPHLGERFYRVDSSRTRSDGGTGLGLAICRGTIDAHDGTISFASEVGKGTTVTVRLPAAVHEQ